MIGAIWNSLVISSFFYFLFQFWSPNTLRYLWTRHNRVFRQAHYLHKAFGHFIFIFDNLFTCFLVSTPLGYQLDSYSALFVSLIVYQRAEVRLCSKLVLRVQLHPILNLITETKALFKIERKSTMRVREFSCILEQRILPFIVDDEKWFRLIFQDLLTFTSYISSRRVIAKINILTYELSLSSPPIVIH